MAGLNDGLSTNDLDVNTLTATTSTATTENATTVNATTSTTTTANVTNLNVSSGALTLNPTGVLTGGTRVTAAGYIPITVDGLTRYINLYSL